MKLLTKLKHTTISILPLLTWFVWLICNIVTALFWLMNDYYVIIHISTNILGACVFYASIKYHNTYLQNKTKTDIVMEVTEGKLKGGKGYTRNPPIPENYTKPKQPPCPPPPPSREYKCTFFGLVETQESIKKREEYMNSKLQHEPNIDYKVEFEKAVYNLLWVWYQYSDNKEQTSLMYSCMGAGENASDFLERHGFGKDVGWSFEPNEKALELMDNSSLDE